LLPEGADDVLEAVDVAIVDAEVAGELLDEAPPLLAAFGTSPLLEASPGGLAAGGSILAAMAELAAAVDFEAACDGFCAVV
jgi:hypothetical protein